MKKLTNTLMRGLVALTVAGMGLALTPSVASADVLIFEVNEDAVPDADAEAFDVDGMTGKYLENLVLNADGTFSATLVVEFAAYTLGELGGTALLVDSQIGATVPSEPVGDENLYGLYALVSVEGLYLQSVNGFGDTVFDFAPQSATADLYTDPSRDTTKDYLALTTANDGDDQYIMSASILDPTQSIGAVTIRAGAVLTGSYALVFTDPALESPDGPLYWPGLAGFTLTAAIASGDVDPAREGSVFPSAIRGDTSIAFEGTAVPEPTTLSLLGLGLLGVATAARRRRKA